MSPDDLAARRSLPFSGPTQGTDPIRRNLDRSLELALCPEIPNFNTDFGDYVGSASDDA